MNLVILVVFQDPAVTQVTDSSIQPADLYNPFSSQSTVRLLKCWCFFFLTLPFVSCFSELFSSILFLNFPYVFSSSTLVVSLLLLLFVTCFYSPCCWSCCVVFVISYKITSSCFLRLASLLIPLQLLYYSRLQSPVHRWNTLTLYS